MKGSKSPTLAFSSNVGDDVDLAIPGKEVARNGLPNGAAPTIVAHAATQAASIFLPA